jgi:Fe-S oxidoreductase
MSTNKAEQELKKRFNRLVGTSATNLCTHCGWCVDTCHVYLATKDPMLSPVAKAERVRKVYKKKFDWLSKVFSFWTGAKELTENELEEWIDVAFKNCTLCERCVINCPMAVETPQILGAARGTLTALGKSPEIFDQLADASIAREENLDTIRDFFVQQIKLLEKQVQEQLNNPDARIPMDEKADILYVPLSGAHTMLPQALIFNSLDVSWTMSFFEASNYGLFISDLPRAKRITYRILKEAQRLEVKEIVVSECGHAYSLLKWEAPKWFDGGFTYQVKSIVELLDEYIQQGRLNLNPAKNPDAVTYHDPCNVGRKGGIFEEPRRVIQAAAADYREMTPNREQNFCCGGGGGLVAELDWEEFRIKCGEPKAEQIRETGAKTVITSCDNCRHQINQLSESYKLDVNVLSVSELVIQAMAS